MSYKLTPRRVLFSDKSPYRPKDNGVAQNYGKALFKKVRGAEDTYNICIEI